MDMSYSDDAPAQRPAEHTGGECTVRGRGTGRGLPADGPPGGRGAHYILSICFATADLMTGGEPWDGFGSEVPPWLFLVLRSTACSRRRNSIPLPSPSAGRPSSATRRYRRTRRRTPRSSGP